MRTGTFIFSAVAAVCSALTLGVVVLGAKRMDDEMMKLKLKTNDSLDKFKSAVQNLEF